MPDQSEASSEHALLQEITAPLATLPEDPVPVAADVDFPIVLRGYDRVAVDAYVRKTSQLVAELQVTRSPEAAVRRALERVGEEVSGILQRAHETAAQITSQSRREAEDRLEAARREALEITAAARDRVNELDAETDRVWTERLRIVDDARELARQLLALADSAAERFPAEEPLEGEPLDEEPAANLQATAPRLAAVQPGVDAEEPELFDQNADGEEEEATAIFPVPPADTAADEAADEPEPGPAHEPDH